MNKKVILELIWWVVTAIIVVLIMFPIYNTVGGKYTFYLPNIFLIALFVTFTRYIFLLKYTLFADNKKLKVVLIFFPILLFFYAINSLFNFQDYIDKDEHIQMLSHLSPDSAMEIYKYMKYQFLFFGTGSMLVIFLFPIRMIISVWRSINTDTV